MGQPPRTDDSEGIALLSRAQALALIERACDRVLDSSSYFAALADRPGLHRAIQKSIDDLRHAGINPAEIKAASFEDARKAADLAKILEAYDEEMRAGGYVDWFGVLARATVMLEEGPESQGILRSRPPSPLAQDDKGAQDDRVRPWAKDAIWPCASRKTQAQRLRRRRGNARLSIGPARSLRSQPRRPRLRLPRIDRVDRPSRRGVVDSRLDRTQCAGPFVARLRGLRARHVERRCQRLKIDYAELGHLVGDEVDLSLHARKSRWEVLLQQVVTLAGPPARAHRARFELHQLFRPQLVEQFVQTKRIRAVQIQRERRLQRDAGQLHEEVGALLQGGRDWGQTLEVRCDEAYSSAADTGLRCRISTVRRIIS